MNFARKGGGLSHVLRKKGKAKAADEVDDITEEAIRLTNAVSDDVFTQLSKRFPEIEDDVLNNFIKKIQALDDEGVQLLKDFSTLDAELLVLVKKPELVESWKILYKIGEINLPSRLEDIKLIDNFLKNHPDKTADLLLSSINSLGGFKNWVTKNLFDLIDESDNLGGILVDVVENVAGEITIRTTINSNIGGKTGVFCSSYIANANRMVLKTALNAEGVKVANVGGVEVGINYYNVVRHMKKMGVPKDGLKQIVHSEVVNKETVMYFHKIIEESNVLNPKAISEDLVLQCPFVRLDRIMLRNMGYEVTSARISGNGRYIDPDLYIESRFVDMTEDELITLGVDIDNDEICYMFNIEVDVVKK